MAATSAHAESSDKAIQPDALEIARILSPDGYLILRSTDLGTTRSELQKRLLNTISGQYGAPCDQRNSACTAAASAIAMKYADKVQAAQKQAIQKIFARNLSGMERKDLASIKAFLDTSAGTRFAANLKLLFDPFGPEAVSVGIVNELNSARIPIAGMHEEFFEATKHLPKAELPRVPRPEPPARKRDQ